MFPDLPPPDKLRLILEDSFGRSPFPVFFTDASVRERMRRQAEASGLTGRLRARLADARPIAVYPFSARQEYRRTGGRKTYERLFCRRYEQIAAAVLLCRFGEDQTTLLEDLIWAECESSSWIIPAHEGQDNPVDLGAAMSARHLAAADWWVGELLDPRLRARLRQEVRRRIFDPFFDPAHAFWWKRTTCNWNAVCHAGIGIAAMLLEDRPRQRAALLAETVRNLEQFIAGFTADGGCSEGPGYWRYGFGWYVDFADALHEYTGGRLNLMAGPRLRDICRYPLACNIVPGQELLFADAASDYLPLATALRINTFHHLPELFSLCRLNPDRTAVAETLEELALYDGRPFPAPAAPPGDAVLPGLGVAKLRAGATTLAAKAGHNDEHHNHNDVGTFLLHRGRTFFLAELGAPVYTSRTFSDQRYQSLFCNSLGHSVPVIGGHGQQTGRDRAGSLAVENAGADGTVKAAVLEIAAAYGLPELHRLTRRLELDAAGNELRLADAFAFTAAPPDIEEAFLTFLPAAVTPDGTAVVLDGGADGTLLLNAAAAGTWTVADLTEACTADGRKGDIARRIAFRPAAAAAAETVLAFRFRFNPPPAIPAHVVPRTRSRV